MSGIAGIVGPLQSDGSQHRDSVEAMLSQLRHRGPDGSKVLAWDHVCFGHARLSTNDSSQHVDEPLSHAEGRYWIVLDGEIYNSVELRDRLDHQFETHSDAEVVLAAFERWGPDSLSYFNGTWAFAIYDRRERACYVARDRFGVKPLYSAYHNETLLFASEMKALLAAGVPAEPNLETMRLYVRWGHWDWSDLTPFKAIHQLPAGHYMVVRDGEWTTHRWWDTLANTVDVPRKFADRTERFRELLQDAVRLRLRGDGKTAIALSGGMDSSTLYALSKALGRSNSNSGTTGDRTADLDVFSVSYPDQPLDESAYVEHCLRPYGDRAHYVYPKADVIPQLLDKIIWHQESPIRSAWVFAHHALFEAIGEAGTRVILEGHGGDEMLAGYPRLVVAALRSFLARADWRGAWQAQRCLFATINPDTYERKVPSWQVYAGHLPLVGRGLSLWQRGVQRLRTARGASGGAKTMLPQEYLSPELLAPSRDGLWRGGPPGLDPLRASLYDAFHRGVLPSALRVSDRATTASSLVSRTPYMDHRVVQYAFSLPMSDLVGAGETKHILREAMRGIVPAPVVNRKRKTPFGAPIQTWFNDPVVHSHLGEIIHDPAFAEHGLIDGAAFAAYFDRCVKKGFGWDDTNRVWQVVNLSVWWQVFVGRRIQVGHEGPLSG